MFKTVYLFLLVTLLSSCVMDFNHLRYYKNLNTDEQYHYRVEPYGAAGKSDAKVFAINAHDFLAGIDKDTTHYKLIVFFTFWCSGSNKQFPELVEKTKQQNNRLRTFFITPDDYVYKYDYLNYAKQMNLKQPVYFLDFHTYGKKRNPHTKMHRFVSEICPICRDIKGFPSFILFSPNNQPIFKHTGSLSLDSLAKKNWGKTH